MRHALAIAVAASLALSACTEDRVIRNDGPLMGLPGSKSMQERRVNDRGTLLPMIADDATITENPDGTRTARATTVKQLIANIARCLDEDWETLFISDVLSTRAKADMGGTGMTPEQAFRQLKSQRDDLIKLFNLMPMGEYTPGYFLQGVGPRTFRLEVPGKAADHLPFRGIDAVYEKSNYRLYWFVKQPGH